MLNFLNIDQRQFFREDLAALSLKVFKVKLDGAWSNLL